MNASFQNRSLYGFAAVLIYFSAMVAGQINLRQWKLTLPFGRPGRPTEVTSGLSQYSRAPYFYRKSSNGPYVFVTPVGGVTTGNSKYPRTELREMNGNKPAAWSTTKGTHTMTFEASVQRMGKAKPDIVVGQVHDSEDDVLQIRFRHGQAQIVWANDDKEVVVDNRYVLGERFRCKIVARNGKIQVFYNDLSKPAVTFSSKSSGCYFKVGNYLQTNPSKGDSAKNYGEVWVYSATVTHS